MDSSNDKTDKILKSVSTALTEHEKTIKLLKQQILRIEQHIQKMQKDIRSLKNSNNS